LTDKMNNSLKL